MQARCTNVKSQVNAERVLTLGSEDFWKSVFTSAMQRKQQLEKTSVERPLKYSERIQLLRANQAVWMSTK